MLPLAPDLDIAKLSRLFKKTTNSYKYLLFLTILQQITRNPTSRTISVSDITQGLLSNAWHPCKTHKLSFGISDQIPKILEPIAEICTFSTSLKESDNHKIRKLMRFVPYRLLQPFFESPLRGILDHKKNALVITYAEQADDHKTPYRFIFCDNTLTHIELTPPWHDYFQRNIPILLDWTKKNWIDFLQARNPNAPAIPTKIEHKARATLSQQRKLWEKFISYQPITCIYTGMPINIHNFALDHFVPWSFVCHDQIWNLLPVDPSANSSKNATLPDPLYINKAAQQQLQAIRYWLKEIRNPKLVQEDLLAGLGLSDPKSTDAADILEKLTQTYQSQLTSATLQGFKGGWLYRLDSELRNTKQEELRDTQQAH